MRAVLLPPAGQSVFSQGTLTPPGVQELEGGVGWGLVQLGRRVLHTAPGDAPPPLRLPWDKPSPFVFSIIF